MTTDQTDVKPPRTSGFWSRETIHARLSDSSVKPPIVADYDKSRLDAVSYKLRVGEEAFVTPSSDDADPAYKTKRFLRNGESIAIPSGQFAILCTEETVNIPFDTIGFIALRSKDAKFKGLVNVSGFHVDPGYSGKLIFAVFNAGPGAVHVARGDEWFMIAFAGLDRTSDEPRRDPNDYKNIPTSVLSPLTGQFLTLKGLDAKIDNTESELIERLHVIEREHTITRWAAALVLVSVIALGVRQCAPPAAAAAPPAAVMEHGS